MKRTIEIKTRDVYGSGDSWVATVTLFVSSMLSYRAGELASERTVESDDVTEAGAIAGALTALARELRDDERGISDRCEAIEIALRWWSDLVVPKVQCQNQLCCHLVPADELGPWPVDNRLVCGECQEDAVDDDAFVRASLEADERAREREAETRAALRDERV